MKWTRGERTRPLRRLILPDRQGAPVSFLEMEIGALSKVHKMRP
jgi:hypothetical protein